MLSAAQGWRRPTPEPRLSRKWRLHPMARDALGLLPRRPARPKQCGPPGQWDYRRTKQAGRRVANLYGAGALRDSALAGHRLATLRGAVLRCANRADGSLSLCRCRRRRCLTLTEGTGAILVRSKRCSLPRSRWSSNRSIMLSGIRDALASSILSPPAKSSPSSRPNTAACMRAIMRAVASVTTAPAKRPSRWRYFNQNRGTSKI
jgi:hypothetical protein